MIGPQQSTEVLLFFCPEGAIDPLPKKLIQQREVDEAGRQSGMLSHAPGWVLQGVQSLTGFGHCVRRRKCALVAYTSWRTQSSQASFQPKKAPQAGQRRNSHHTGWFKVKTNFQEQHIFASHFFPPTHFFFLTQKGNICCFFFPNCLEP